MSPEVMMGEEFNEKADVYSFGLILWFLVTKKEPYEEYDDLDSFSHAVCLQQVRPVIPADCIPRFPFYHFFEFPSLADLIRRCWDPRPSVRPSFSEIVFQLDHVIVDLAIDDPLGRQFWKNHFLAKVFDS
jgi:serine/threonine protein kinase